VIRSIIRAVARRVSSRAAVAPIRLPRPSMTLGPGLRRSRWARAVAATPSLRVRLFEKRQHWRDALVPLVADLYDRAVAAIRA
jgi:hypothetical protein